MSDGEDVKTKLSALRRLHADLLPMGYSSKRMVRPVYSEDASLTVRLAIKLSDIVSFELNESNYHACLVDFAVVLFCSLVCKS